MKKRIFIIAGLILIVSFAIFLAYKQTTQTGGEVKQYSKGDENAPKAEVDHSSFDFGVLTSHEKKSHTFNIKNTGKSPLILSNPKSSCDCTSVIIKIGENSSPSFSMHDNKSWEEGVKPGETAEAIVTYDPSVHPGEKGKIERYIYIKTDDPNMENLSLKITIGVY